MPSGFDEKRLTNLKQFLQSLDWIPDNYHLQALSQQATNCTFELKFESASQGISPVQRYLVKYLGQTGFMPLDRLQTLTLQTRLAEVGYAPKPIVLSSDQQYLIEQWQPRSTDMSRAALIAKLGMLMADIHYLDLDKANIECPELALLDHWQGYLQQLASGSDDVLRKRAVFEKQIEQLTPRWRDAKLNSLCHHDFAFQHIASLHNNIIYDWEYGAISCRFFDLANAIHVNGLNMAEQCKLLQRYMLRCHDHYDDKKVTLDALFSAVNDMMPLALLTSDLWWAVYQHYSGTAR